MRAILLKIKQIYYEIHRLKLQDLKRIDVKFIKLDSLPVERAGYSFFETIFKRTLP